MRIVFFGSGDIGLPTLKYLLNHPDLEILAVVAQPDRPAGRKLVLTPPATKVLAVAASIPVLQPGKVREILPNLAEMQADLYVVIAYGQILPKALLAQPRLACINLHASLLPKYRGAAPIQAAILAGDAESGMTVMHVDVGLDSGDVILAKPLPLRPDETGGTLHDRLAEIGPEALDAAISALCNGNAPRTPQDPALVSHIGKLSREDGIIDWSRPAQELERRIRAFEPWPGTSSVLTETDSPPKNVKIFPPTSVEPLPETEISEPGQILRADKNGILVACGNAALCLHSLQLEGRKRVTAAEFAAGMPDLARKRFGNLDILR